MGIRIIIIMNFDYFFFFSFCCCAVPYSKMQIARLLWEIPLYPYGKFMHIYLFIYFFFNKFSILFFFFIFRRIHVNVYDDGKTFRTFNLNQHIIPYIHIKKLGIAFKLKNYIDLKSVCVCVSVFLFTSLLCIFWRSIKFIESHWNWMQRYHFRLIYRIQKF